MLMFSLENETEGVWRHVQNVSRVLFDIFFLSSMPNKQKRTRNILHYFSHLKEDGIQTDELKGSKRGRCWQAEVKMPPNQCKADVVKMREGVPLPLQSSSLQSNRGHMESPHLLHRFLQDIQASNTAFQVQNVFRMLQKKANERWPDSGMREKNFDLKKTLKSTEKDSKGPRFNSVTPKAPSSSLSMQFSVETCPRVSKLSRTRRMKRQVPSDCGNSCKDTDKTLETIQKDSSCEDVLWTDKYSPRCANEVIGNILQVSKLHNWLKMWKLHTASSENRTVKQLKSEEKCSGNISTQDTWDCGDFQGDVGSKEPHEEPLCNAMLITGPSGVGKTASVYACAQELGFQVFEVNSSSQRNGRQVLSQLREATQSHLVEMTGKDPLKAAYFSNYNTRGCTPTSEHLAGGKLQPPRKVTLRSKKQTFGGQRSTGTKSSTAVTLTNFKMKAKADQMYGLFPADTPHDKLKQLSEYQTTPQNTNGATSLILFEEVDVIFEDDVGFLAAIKTFMTTTKRPVVLTTNDPTFRERFGGNLEEVIFKKPSVVNLCSYLQLLCLAEGVKMDTEDVRSLVTLTAGDVRRCLLQLQLWVKSGEGATIDGQDAKLPQCSEGCTKRMLGLHPLSRNGLLTFLKNSSWTEADMNKLVESWRRNFPLLYSNLDILIPFRSYKENSVLQSKLTAVDINLVRHGHRLNSMTPSGSSLTCNGHSSSYCLKATQYHRTEQSAANVHLKCLNALADFSELMSYMDATIPTAEALDPAACARDFVWTGAVIKDSLLDETSEVEEWSYNQEKLLEIRAFVEGLGCRRCWSQMSVIWTQAQTCCLEPTLSQFSNGLQLTCQPPIDPIMCQRRYKMSQAVLNSQPFGLLGNRQAIFVDYMPTLRSISRSVRQQKGKQARCVNYLRSLHLGLSKSVLQLLGQDISSTSLTV
ncbi:ATPase family AAA domain-containing protein 5b isoform X2 [Corythoichthys intestinalis]|uniref:ATPase family AAA domain-containing protein 5b isoform X2 n=1 Tax=Corythoichthys intestinalis TaxID=161448 RepID=UPI0025A6399D|nr:ATPase family AAA domain-containing protein 5b isoform X2 [Corythoichthys intestinalis]